MNATSPTPIFVISLKGSPRREKFLERAKDTPLRWRFFDAFTARAPGLAYLEREAAVLNGRALTAGEIGCYSSHYALWRQLLDDDAEKYIILEDDVIVDWKRLEMLAALDMQSLGIIYLRLFFKRPCSLHLLQSHFLGRDVHLVEIRDIAFGTQGYVMTRTAAEVLVPYCRHIVRPIDIQLDRYWDHGVPNLSLFPFVLMEEPGEPSIEPERFGPSRRALRRTGQNLIDLLKRRVWAARGWRSIDLRPTR